VGNSGHVEKNSNYEIRHSNWDGVTASNGGGVYCHGAAAVLSLSFCTLKN
jgi:hypothetical protein